MKTYDVKCPICGAVNKDLYLDETHGWFVCDKCDNDSQILAYANTVKIPVYTGEQIAKMYASVASLAASKGA